jgi:hypothetical protein
VCKVHRFVYGVTRRNYANVHLFFSCQPKAGDDARPEVDQGTVRARDGGVRIEHFSIHRPVLVYSQDDFGCRGKLRKADTFGCSPQRGQVTAIDRKGNSSTPGGTLRRHRLHVTTNCFRVSAKNPTINKDRRIEGESRCANQRKPEMKTLAPIPGGDLSRCSAEILLGSVRHRWQLR